MSALARLFGLSGRRTLHVPPPAQLLDHAGRRLAEPDPVLLSIRQRRLRSNPPTGILPGSELRMGKRALRAAQMLAEAQDWADRLTLSEMRDPTEPLEDVWRRLERKTGVPYGTFWSLRWRYRQLKDIWGSVHSLLQEAHQQREQKHLRRREHADDVAALTGRSRES